MNETPTIGPKALMTNPALERLQFLIGTWRTKSRHPAVPGKVLSGRTSFAWHMGGAFLIMHGEVDEPGFPNGVAIIGSDADGSHGQAGGFTMIYFDERGVSRLYQVMVGEGTVSWRRDDAKFSQTNTITAQGQDRLVSQGRMSRDGGAWEDDLSQEFQREG